METNKNKLSHPEHQDKQCISSFTAFASDQSKHVIEVWIHRDAVHYGDPKRISPALLFLVTTDGREVDRIDQGTYCLKDQPDVTFSTNDLNAP